MKARKYLLFCILFSLFAIGCAPAVTPAPEFAELRLHRWTGLEGGETLVIRRVGNEWSAMLLGDGDRFSCLYQKSVKPKSEWQVVWDRMISLGLDSLPNAYKAEYVVEDGNGYEVELSYQGKLKRLSIPHPEFQNSSAAKQILEIGDFLSREFDTPVFVAKYDRGKVGDYLIANCEELRK